MGRRPRWQPQPAEYDQVWSEQSPWLRTGEVPAALAPPTERLLARALPDRLLDDRPRRFHVILGPRRVGKSTVMYQVVRALLARGVPARRVLWLRLDHPLWLRVELGDLVRRLVERAAATEQEPLYLFLDEVNYARDWDRWLKAFFDERWPVRIVATSSATAAIRERTVESGVGRWDEHILNPYLFAEYLDLAGIETPEVRGRTIGDALASMRLAQPAPGLAAARTAYMLCGGFPEILAGLRLPVGDIGSLVLDSQRRLRSDAVERAIYKDIPQVFGVDDPLVLERTLYTLAGQVAGLLSPTQMARDVSVSMPTLDKYVSYLERAFLVFLLPNWSGSERSIQRRGRKVYFHDGAVRNAALQRGLRPLSDAPEMGLLCENLCAAHLRALADARGVRLFHWRDGDDEVDLVLDDPAAPMAFEIASSPRHPRRGLDALTARAPRFRSNTWIVAPDAGWCPPSAERHGAVDMDLFLCAVGRLVEIESAARIRA